MIKVVKITIQENDDVLKQINKFLEDYKITDDQVINIETNIQKDIYTIWYREASLCEEKQIKQLSIDGKSKDEIAAELAKLYVQEKHYYSVAVICDEVLDKSGALLGKVRDEALKLKGK